MTGKNIVWKFLWKWKVCERKGSRKTTNENIFNLFSVNSDQCINYFCNYSNKMHLSPAFNTIWQFEIKTCFCCLQRKWAFEKNFILLCHNYIALCSIGNNSDEKSHFPTDLSASKRYWKDLFSHREKRSERHLIFFIKLKIVKRLRLVVINPMCSKKNCAYTFLIFGLVFCVIALVCGFVIPKIIISILDERSCVNSKKDSNYEDLVRFNKISFK